jgi:hypothetical protein
VTYKRYGRNGVSLFYFILDFLPGFMNKTKKETLPKIIRDKYSFIVL